MPNPPSRFSANLRRYLPAIVIFVVVVVLWEALVIGFKIQRFILPAPTDIAAAFMGNLPRLVSIGWYTTQEALGGFFIGCTLGIIVAFLTARFSFLNEAMMPFAIAANSVPILAFAPILNNWFGLDSQLSKMAIVAVIVFFPMMINTVRGLTLVDAGALELMQSYAASDLEILWKLRIPNALPFMFNAFKLAASLSMIGAVVGEYFGGNRSALGVFITQEAAGFRFDNAWSAIIIACIVGISFYLLISFIERLLIPWHASMRHAEES